MDAMTSERERRYASLWDSPAWKVLRADRAAWFLAFLADLFDGVSEVPWELARAQLEQRYRVDGAADPGALARQTLNRWITEGLLIQPAGDRLFMTAKGQEALKFVEGLDSREMQVTESHLETVSEELRRLLIALSPDVEERRRIIDEQIQELERAKQQLTLGLARQLSAGQRRERVRHLYTQAVQLSRDFRLLEDDMRQHADDVAKQIVGDEDNRGTVMVGVLDAEDAMRQSPAGQAFDGFYKMLGDSERRQMFRMRVRRLMELGIGEYLSDDERRYLANIVADLHEQSTRVIHRRRSATETLKTYMTSGAQLEHRAVDRLIKQAQKLAMQIEKLYPLGHPVWKKPLPLTIKTGRTRIAMPSRIRLASPAEALDTDEVVEHINGTELSPESLRAMNGINVHRVADELREVLRTSGSRTLAELAHLRPVRRGVPEVLAMVRIAMMTGAQRFAESHTERFTVTDIDGSHIQVRVPTFVLAYENFPDDMSSFSA